MANNISLIMDLGESNMSNVQEIRNDYENAGLTMKEVIQRADKILNGEY